MHNLDTCGLKYCDNKSAVYYTWNLPIGVTSRCLIHKIYIADFGFIVEVSKLEAKLILLKE